MTKLNRKHRFIHPDWALYLDYQRELKGTPDDILLVEMRSSALQDQIAYGRLMKQFDGVPICVECKHAFLQQWAFVSKDMVNENEYRLNMFDASGFQNHINYYSIEAALQEMIRNHYHVIDCGALDRCSQTNKWEIGLYAQTVRDSYHRGELSWEEVSAKVEAFKTSIGARQLLDDSIQALKVRTAEILTERGETLDSAY